MQPTLNGIEDRAVTIVPQVRDDDDDLLFKTAFFNQ